MFYTNLRVILRQSCFLGISPARENFQLKSAQPGSREFSDKVGPGRPWAKLPSFQTQVQRIPEINKTSIYFKCTVRALNKLLQGCLSVRSIFLFACEVQSSAAYKIQLSFFGEFFSKGVAFKVIYSDYRMKRVLW